jgi:sugar transferase (PEP-CTERM/EpsH1 system associated)
VHLGTLADEPLEPGTQEALAARCQQVAVERLGGGRWLRAAASLATGRSATEGLFRSVKLRRTLEQWTQKVQFDAVVVFCSSMVQYLDLPGLKSVPTVVDLVDVDSQKFVDYTTSGRGLKKWLYQLEARRLRKLECTLPGRVQAITLVSEAEAQIYRSFCPNDRTHAITNGVDLEYFQPTEKAGRPDRCVFVGALDYRPNIEGIVWFCQEVWPKVRAVRPQATLAIVGRNPNPSVRNLTSIPGVEVIGSVPDVRPHLAEATLAVVPLQIARGVQNKVLEAMAMGIPVVASSGAAEGLGVIDGEELLIASSPKNWSASICQLLADAPLRSHLTQSGRQFVEEHHHWEQSLSGIAGLLDLSRRTNPERNRTSSHP